MTTLHVVVRGQVQGVGFRWFVREAARELDLAGWVRNRRDGTVEVAAEGDSDAIAKLRRALGDGPPRSQVTSVDDASDGDLAAAPLGRPFTILK